MRTHRTRPLAFSLAAVVVPLALLGLAPSDARAQTAAPSPSAAPSSTASPGSPPPAASAPSGAPGASGTTGTSGSSGAAGSPGTSGGAGTSGVSSAASGAPSGSSTPAATDELSKKVVVVSDEARRHFRAGVLMLEDPGTPRYEEAYREFKSAYALSPSYKILGNLGLCAMKLERDDEAIASYERYLQEGGQDLDPGDRAQVERDLLTLKAGVVHVDVTTDPPNALLVDVRVPVTGQRVTNVYGPLADGKLHLGLRKGHHVITARVAGRKDAVWELDADDASNNGTHAFTLEVPTTNAVAAVRTRPVPTPVYVGVGVTAVLAIATVVVGVDALKHHSDFTALNDGNHVSEAESARSTGTTLNAVTDVLLAGTVVAAGVTTYLYLSRPTVEERVGRPRLRLSPTVGVRGGGGVLEGSF